MAASGPAMRQTNELGKRTQPGLAAVGAPADHLAARPSVRLVASRRRFAALEDRPTSPRLPLVIGPGSGVRSPGGGEGARRGRGHARMRNWFFVEFDGRNTWRVVDHVTGLGVADALGTAFRDLPAREAQQIVRDLELGQAAGPLPSYVAGDLLCVDRDQWLMGPWTAGPHPGPD